RTIVPYFDPVLSFNAPIDSGEHGSNFSPAGSTEDVIFARRCTSWIEEAQEMVTACKVPLAEHESEIFLAVFNHLDQVGYQAHISETQDLPDVDRYPTDSFVGRRIDTRHSDSFSL